MATFIRIEGISEVKSELAAFKRYINDPDTIEVGMEQIKKFHDQNFLKQGSPKKWKPLSAETESARQKRSGYYKKSPAGGGGILAWTGNLRDNNTVNVRAGEGIFAKNAPYAEYHQEGGGKLPKREVLPSDPRMSVEIVKAITERISDFIVRRGFA